MNTLRNLIALTLLTSVVALAVDVPFEWDINEDGALNGSTLVVHDRKTNTETRYDVEGAATNITVNLPPGTMADVWVLAYSEVLNPDGTVVRLYSEPSNVLDVKLPGKSGNLKVK